MACIMYKGDSMKIMKWIQQIILTLVPIILVAMAYYGKINKWECAFIAIAYFIFSGLLHDGIQKKADNDDFKGIRAVHYEMTLYFATFMGFGMYFFYL